MTVSESVTALFSGLPLTVSVAGPRVAVLLAVSVSALAQVGLQGVFVTLALTPVGSPPTLRLTGWVVPERRVAVIVLVTLLPCTRVRLVGLAPRL